MTEHCPSCKAAFEPKADRPSRATAVCPACGRVVVLSPDQAGPASSNVAPDESGTAPLLEPLGREEGPTRIGVASQTLSLPAGKRVSVAILSGARKGEGVTLARPRLTFGRAEPGSTVDVPLSDPEVSREHAAIECHGDRIVLRDLDSRHGTYLGEERIARREIQDGAEFRIGSTRLMLVVTDA